MVLVHIFFESKKRTDPALVHSATFCSLNCVRKQIICDNLALNYHALSLTSYL